MTVRREIAESRSETGAWSRESAIAAEVFMNNVG